MGPVELPRPLWRGRHGTCGNKIRGLAGSQARSAAAGAVAEENEGLTNCRDRVRLNEFTARSFADEDSFALLDLLSVALLGRVHAKCADCGISELTCRCR